MNDAPVIDVGDEAQVNKRKANKKTAEQQEAEDLRHVMSHYAGRAFMWRLLTRCKLFDEGFNTDPLVMARDAGRRNIGLSLVADIHEADAQAYLKMQNEAIKRDKPNG